MKTKKRKVTVVTDGDTIEVTVRKMPNGIMASLPRKVLRYLHANEGDKLKLRIRNGGVEIQPVVSLEEEIDSYVSHTR